MQKRRAVRWIPVVLTGCFALSVATLFPGCGGGGGGGPVPVLVSFAGLYTGSFTGATTGTFSFTVDANGDIVAVVHTSDFGNLRGTGHVATDGTFSFTGPITNSQTSFQFTGTMRTVNGLQTASGSWRNSTGQSGSFAATQAFVPTPTPGLFIPTPTPRPTPTPTPVPNGFAGVYNGTATITQNPPLTATLNFTVGITGNVSGTLQGPSGPTSLAGTVNGSTGSVLLTGAFTTPGGQSGVLTLTGRIRTQNGATSVVEGLLRSSTGLAGTWAATRTG